MINTIFVDKITEVLDKLAPIKKLQRQKNHKNWIDN